MKHNAHVVHSAEEGDKLLETLKFPVLIIPWGEGSGVAQYVVRSPESYLVKLEKALDDSIHKKAVHVIELWQPELNPHLEATFAGTPS